MERFSALGIRDNYIECACDLPKISAANDTLELIKRGDISGMSFAFEDDYQDSENGVSYERTSEVEDGKEVWLRHVKRITGLYDVAIVTHPAYEQTTVGTREAGDEIDKAIEAQLKREAAPQETEEERKAREQREAEEKAAAEKKEQEEREMEELERRAREAQAVMRMRRNKLALEIEEIDF